MTVWIEGEWLQGGAIPANDRGFLLGDGLFETIRVSAGKPLRLARHVERLRKSAKILALADPFAGIMFDEIIEEAVERSGLGESVVRFSVSAGAGQRGLLRSDGPLTRVLQVSARPDIPASVDLATSEIRRSGSAVSTRHKTLSYIDNIAARSEARAAGADMALLRDTADNVSGADCANIIWSRGGALHTPSLSCAVLPGTVRAVLTERVGLQEDEAGLADVMSADGVFISNAVMGVVPVRAVDGQELAGNPDALAILRDALS